MATTKKTAKANTKTKKTKPAKKEEINEISDSKLTIETNDGEIVSESGFVQYVIDENKELMSDIETTEAYVGEELEDFVEDTANKESAEVSEPCETKPVVKEVIEELQPKDSEIKNVPEKKEEPKQQPKTNNSAYGYTHFGMIYQY